jgi:hypothetical protein
MDKRWRKARTENNWGERDLLGDIPFRGGEFVEVHWNDATKVYKVHMSLNFQEIRDGFSQTRISIEKAYISVFRKGYPRRLRVTDAPKMRFVEEEN